MNRRRRGSGLFGMFIPHRQISRQLPRQDEKLRDLLALERKVKGEDQGLGQAPLVECAIHRRRHDHIIIMVHRVADLHRETFPDDVAPGPFVYGAESPMFAQLIVYERIVHELGEERFEISLIGGRNVGGDRSRQ